MQVPPPVRIHAVYICVTYREGKRPVQEFIRAYLGKYQRWLSPLYLAGESYGTVCAAALPVRYTRCVYGAPHRGAYVYVHAFLPVRCI